MLLASKTLDVLLSPLAWALLLLVAALAAHRRERLANSLIAAAVLVLLAFSSEWVAQALLRRLEAGAVRTYREGVTYDAAILLGGGADPGASAATGDLELNAAGDRIVRTWELLRAGRVRNVIVSAGELDPLAGAPREADRTAERLRAWGVAPGRIVVEASSRNTRENAVESARIARERGWKSLVVVTSAAHVPRALGCFRAAGVTPDALPVDRRGAGVRLSILAFLPRARALAASSEAIREWAGRLVYRAAGWST